MKPWYREGLRFGCTNCSDCCRSHGEYVNVYLSVTDVTRLAGTLKLERKVFLHQYTDRVEDGIWKLKWPEDACVFLGEKGCTVYDGRPEQCRTWPFWPENLRRDVWEKEIAPFCPGVGEGRLYTLGEIRKLARGEGKTTLKPE